MHHFVTGVAGFIGSHLADSLLERGDSVSGVDHIVLRSEVRMHLYVDARSGFLAADQNGKKDAPSSKGGKTSPAVHPVPGAEVKATASNAARMSVDL